MLVWTKTKNEWTDWAWQPCIVNDTNDYLNFVVAYRQSTYSDVGECTGEEGVPDNYDIHYPLYWRVVYVAQPMPDEFFFISEYDEDELRHMLELKVKVLGLEALGIERLQNMKALKEPNNVR